MDISEIVDYNKCKQINHIIVQTLLKLNKNIKEKEAVIDKLNYSLPKLKLNLDFDREAEINKLKSKLKKITRNKSKLNETLESTQKELLLQTDQLNNYEQELQLHIVNNSSLNSELNRLSRNSRNKYYKYKQKYLLLKNTVI